MSVVRIPGIRRVQTIGAKVAGMADKVSQYCTEKIHFYHHLPICNSSYTQYDLMDLDSRYREMHEMHSRAHIGLIDEMHEDRFATVLEVACGTGWNVPHFKNVKLEYYGMDISETAIIVAMLKYPENRYFNLGICDAKMMGDGNFDIVYSSSMLEHIGYYKEALKEMVRVAKKEVRILFFEGLSDEDENKIDFHPYSESAVSGVDKDIFGRKVVLQDHIYETRKGWYWNRYSRKKILEYSRTISSKVEVLDRTNRPFLDQESVLIMHK